VHKVLLHDFHRAPLSPQVAYLLLEGADAHLTLSMKSRTRVNVSIWANCQCIIFLIDGGLYSVTALRETWARRLCILNTRIYRKQASTTSKARCTRRSLVTAEVLGEVVSLVAIRVQVNRVCLLLIGVLWVSLEVPPSKVLVA